MWPVPSPSRTAFLVDKSTAYSPGVPKTSLVDVDVIEQGVYDYGSGSLSPVSRLPHCTLVALAMLAPPVITDFESQNKSVPFPVIWVKGFVPVPTATVDRLAATKPP